MRKEAKSIIGCDIALLCGIDSLPFGVVNGSRFEDYCVNILLKLMQVTYLVTETLQQIVYRTFTPSFTAIKELLAKESELVKDTATVALDVWTDS
ncbi:hypothetical protein QYM36_002910 [Artemia franciscana]|uniref:Uncharacterized protein n=1 Tax=Artemia franciscana TaxID=6661 RepID=A0AA88I744_ARTSF|nr:hypothetical protein QYM36_003701 [Artemia franciscana]KAK2722523.1 hypothetical protein QYM36_002910 [Artemia franciscana]